MDQGCEGCFDPLQSPFQMHFRRRHKVTGGRSWINCKTSQMIDTLAPCQLLKSWIWPISKWLIHMLGCQPEVISKTLQAFRFCNFFLLNLDLLHFSRSTMRWRRCDQLSMGRERFPATDKQVSDHCRRKGLRYPDNCIREIFNLSIIACKSLCANC